MTSPRPRPGRPIEFVELRITFRADRREAARIMRAVPSAVVRWGVCEVRVEAEEPGEVAEKARELLARLRGSV